MLWIAIHFPALPLEIHTRGGLDAEALAVVERHGNRSSVLACNVAASRCGVKTGMAASAAQALADGLVLKARDPAAESEALSGIAAWAGRFTPSVSLQPPHGVLLEVGSCLRLHRGFDRLMGQVRAGLEDLGYASRIATATTPHGAWLLALARDGIFLRDAARLERILGALPIHLLQQSPETLDGLELIGAHTIAECLRLPRAGLVRRFGRALTDELDRALGKAPEPREFFVPPASFERRLELPALVHEAGGLLFAVHRLLPELEGYLNLRQAGIQQLDLVCRHEDVADTVIAVGFHQPTRSLERMKLLMRETLSGASLPAAVHTIALAARVILPLELANRDLFDDGKRNGDGELLLERLRIRLGKESVAGLSVAPDHRPELAWRADGPGMRGAAKSNRPLWLLPQPATCTRGDLEIQSGPERIESGWWDGGDVARDYYVARHRNGSRLWVYREHASGRWFVHGLFA